MYIYIYMYILVAQHAVYMYKAFCVGGSKKIVLYFQWWI